MNTPFQEAEMPTVLLVDDDPVALDVLEALLRREHYRLLYASSGEEALRMLEAFEIGVVLTDRWMPGMSGVELLTRVHILYPHVVRVVLSGEASDEGLSEAIDLGDIHKFFTKPWDNKALIAAIREAFRG